MSRHEMSAGKRSSKRTARETAAPRLAAIRSFFVEPKESYTIEELETMYAGDVPDIVQTLDLNPPRTVATRRTAAAMLRGYVPPTVIGRALDGLPAGPLTNETRAIELPVWLWRALETIAEERGWSVSDTLSEEMIGCLEGGVSAAFEEAAELPDYVNGISTGRRTA